MSIFDKIAILQEMPVYYHEISKSYSNACVKHNIARIAAACHMGSMWQIPMLVPCYCHIMTLFANSHARFAVFFVLDSNVTRFILEIK